MTPDVNVLVAASRADHAHHAPALAWLQQALSGAPQGEPLSIQPMVVASFLRLVTNARIFTQPTPVQEALKFVEALRSSPSVVQPELGSEWEEFRALCANKSLIGNEIPDAWLAAAVIYQGEHLVSFDRYFQRLLPRGRFTLLAASGSQSR